MSRQNRVTPFGDVEADPARGTLMGNRGCLVRAEGELVRQWQVQRWITCVLEFKGRRRHPLMRAGQYTELFFLDEATACAAGHRPCHECRRADAREFHAAWRDHHPEDERLPDLDARLHHERTAGALPTARCAELPDAAMVRWGGRAWVVTGGTVRAWTHAGYTDERAPPSEPVTVLTPPSTVEVLRTGWRPAVHPSARA